MASDLTCSNNSVSGAVQGRCRVDGATDGRDASLELIPTWEVVLERSLQRTDRAILLDDEVIGLD
jgi:hypothetical protein